MVDVKPSPADQKVKYEFLHYASQIFHKFPVVYTLLVTDDEIWSQIYALTPLGDDKNGVNSANDNNKSMITDKDT